MRSKTGTVVSKSGNKSIVVESHYYKEHPKYKNDSEFQRNFMLTTKTILIKSEMQ